MRLFKVLAAAATISVAAAPIAAQASENLPARVASKDDGQAIAGVSTVLLLLIVAAAIAVVVVVADNNNKPASP